LLRLLRNSTLSRLPSLESTAEWIAASTVILTISNACVQRLKSSLIHCPIRHVKTESDWSWTRSWRPR
jgi:hypothetical protein